MERFGLRRHTERTALATLRESAKAAAQHLAADCPQDVPAAPSARLEAVEQGDRRRARGLRQGGSRRWRRSTARSTTSRRRASTATWRRRPRLRARPRPGARRRTTGARPRVWVTPPSLARLRRRARDRARRALELRAAGRVLRARHLLAQGRRHARERLPRRERAHPGRPHGRDAPAPCRRARRHRRDPPRARALLRGARPGAEGEVCGDELGGDAGLAAHRVCDAVVHKPANNRLLAANSVHS